MTALYVCSKTAAEKQVSILADGGITKSGDIVEALTLTQGVICGGMFGGCLESPGDVVEVEGKLYKQCRGMGCFWAENLEQLRKKARDIRVNTAGQREASPHDVLEFKIKN